MKLLASDYDDTFNTYDLEKNIRAMKKFMNDGNLFVIVTGRSYPQIIKDIEQYHIEYNYLVCNDGALIFDNAGKVLYRKDIEQYLVKSIINYIKDDPRINNYVIDDGSGTTLDENSPANGIICEIADREKGIELLLEIKEKFEGVHGYISMPHLNITDISVDKASGINHVQKIAGISDTEVYTVGNDINDISMIKKYNGYIMKDGKSLLNIDHYRSCSSVYELLDKIR